MPGKPPRAPRARGAADWAARAQLTPAAGCGAVGISRPAGMRGSLAPAL